MFQRIQRLLVTLGFKASLNTRYPQTPDFHAQADPDRRAAEAYRTIETCNDYFRTLAALEDEVAQLTDLDLRDPADRRLVTNMAKLRRLRPEMTRTKARAAAYLLEHGDTLQESAPSPPATDRNGWQLINGGQDLLVQLLDELIHALKLLPDDPEVKRLLDLASARCRALTRRASLRAVPERANDLP
ncbi:hypothetical protein [Methylocaldum szegediense]|jgi:hypothetical protein|uniref:hypothetical protein n=1 Tax=Methylocaldum szegediense TaxID=73780 RepID=UPI0004092E18|nr:hypothetical protein [Methylocaldum szegediense]